MEATIGFLGFGTMGSSIARGLIASGYSPARMQWYNPTERMAERAYDLGMAARAPSAARGRRRRTTTRTRARASSSSYY